MKILITPMIALIWNISFLGAAETVKIWKTVEIKLESQIEYKNPYTDVELWIQLTGPHFNKKIWGFWDGAKTFKVRFVATEPGEWSWISYSNVDDKGLAGQKGRLTAIEWSKDEISKNPNRRGFIRTNPDAPHSFMYADGTPFFLLADTWWAAMTWRYPFKGGKDIPDNYVPDESNWCFEGGIQWLKRLGYNSIAMIASFPNWKVDDYGRVVQDDNGIYIRKAEAWGKAPLGEKVKDMHDEDGNMPFFFPGKCKGKSTVCANYDSLNPAYWQNMDKKMDYLLQNGFVPYIESVRRDQLPVWVHYYDFNQSFARYLNYIKARYGTCNFIFSLVHWDTGQEGISLDNLKGAFSYYYLKYGNLPFGQPVTAMIVESSSKYLGQSDEAPYLTCYSAGNTNRAHGILLEIEKIYNLTPKVPGFNNESYYPWHDVPWGRAGGIRVEPNSELDNYFGRSHMYSNLFSGALGGHVFGTGAFGGDSYGEPPYIGDPAHWPKIWEAITISSLRQGAHFRAFVSSLGSDYQNMIVAYRDLSTPRTKTAALFDWSYMLKTPDNRIIALYFERSAEKQIIRKLQPGNKYSAKWYNTRTGEWTLFKESVLKVSDSGEIILPDFPSGMSEAEDDWAALLVLTK
jgi:hypothetical protein